MSVSDLQNSWHIAPKMNDLKIESQNDNQWFVITIWEMPHWKTGAPVWSPPVRGVVEEFWKQRMEKLVMMTKAWLAKFDAFCDKTETCNLTDMGFCGLLWELSPSIIKSLDFNEKINWQNPSCEFYLHLLQTTAGLTWNLASNAARLMSTDLSNGHLLFIAKSEQFFDPILRFGRPRKSNWLHRLSFSKQISRDFKSLRASRLGFRTKREHEGSSRHKRHMNQEQVTWLSVFKEALQHHWIIQKMRGVIAMYQQQ